MNVTTRLFAALSTAALLGAAAPAFAQTTTPAPAAPSAPAAEPAAPAPSTDSSMAPKKTTKHKHSSKHHKKTSSMAAPK